MSSCYSIGGFQIALTAIESLRRQLASELGAHGIRAVSLRTGGIIDTIPEDFEGGEAIVDSIVEGSMLKRGTTLEDLGQRGGLCRLGPFPVHDRGGPQHLLRLVGRLTAATI